MYNSVSDYGSGSYIVELAILPESRTWSTSVRLSHAPGYGTGPCSDVIGALMWGKFTLTQPCSAKVTLDSPHLTQADPPLPKKRTRVARAPNGPGPSFFPSTTLAPLPQGQEIIDGRIPQARSQPGPKLLHQDHSRSSLHTSVNPASYFSHMTQVLNSFF